MDMKRGRQRRNVEGKIAERSFATVENVVRLNRQAHKVTQAAAALRGRVA